MNLIRDGNVVIPKDVGRNVLKRHECRMWSFINNFLDLFFIFLQIYNLVK
jgi:hypothetical protein